MLQRILSKRIDTARRDGSPIFRDEPGVIANGARYSISIEGDLKGLYKYQFATEINLWNLGSQALDIEINGLAYGVLGAATFMVIREPAIHSATLINNSGSATDASDIRWTFQRAPIDADKLASERA